MVIVEHAAVHICIVSESLKSEQRKNRRFYRRREPAVQAVQASLGTCPVEVLSEIADERTKQENAVEGRLSVAGEAIR